MNNQTSPWIAITNGPMSHLTHSQNEEFQHHRKACTSLLQYCFDPYKRKSSRRILVQYRQNQLPSYILSLLSLAQDNGFRLFCILFDKEQTHIAHAVQNKIRTVRILDYKTARLSEFSIVNYSKDLCDEITSALQQPNPVLVSLSNKQKQLEFTQEFIRSNSVPKIIIDIRSSAQKIDIDSQNCTYIKFENIPFTCLPVKKEWDIQCVFPFANEGEFAGLRDLFETRLEDGTWIAQSSPQNTFEILPSPKNNMEENIVSPSLQSAIISFFISIAQKLSLARSFEEENYAISIFLRNKQEDEELRTSIQNFLTLCSTELLNSESTIYKEAASQYNRLSQNRELEPLDVICETIRQYILKQTQTIQKQSEASEKFIIQLGLKPLPTHKKLVLFLMDHPKEAWKHIHPFIFIPRSELGLYRMWFPSSVHSFLQKEYKRERVFWKSQSQQKDLAVLPDEYHHTP